LAYLPSSFIKVVRRLKFSVCYYDSYNVAIYFLPDIIKVIKYEEVIQACSMHGELRITYKILAENPEGNEPLC